MLFPFQKQEQATKKSQQQTENKLVWMLSSYGRKKQKDYSVFLIGSHFIPNTLRLQVIQSKQMGRVLPY
jgi:hypothetical protein